MTSPPPVPSEFLRTHDRRGLYAPFIAIISVALLILGGIAYDAPRLTAARQDALHVANEAARAAAAVVAGGGTVDDARVAADERVATSSLIYGREVRVANLDCVGSRVEVIVTSRYVFRSVLAVARPRQPIAAIGAAEAVLLAPGGEQSSLHHLGECPL